MYSRIALLMKWGEPRIAKYMAQKRMFDKAIIDTDMFLNVSLTAKALYFLLGMEADDEGFVSPNKVLRLYGGEYGDIKNLIDGGFLIPFKSGVVVITHWNENNWLDSRRIKATQYQEEKKLLSLTENKKYVLSTGLASIEEYSIEERRGDTMSANADGFDEFWNLYPKKEGKKLSREVWNRKKLNGSLKEILTFVTKAKSSDRWMRGFIKAPVVFLRQESWTDDLSSYGATKQNDYSSESIKI